MKNNYVCLKKIINEIPESDYDKIATKIALFLKEIHSNNTVESDWETTYMNLINLTLFNHGLIKQSYLKDYILVDFVEKNKFLIKDRKTYVTIKGNSINDLCINNKFDLLSCELEFGDYVVDFFMLNVIAKQKPQISNLILEKYFEGPINRRFFRLLSLYTAVYCLNLLVRLDKEKDVERKLFFKERLDFLFDIYEDFTIDIPKWYKKNKTFNDY